MLHKIFFSAVVSTAMLAMTGCGLFQSDYPENFPADWKAKEFSVKDARELAPGVTAYSYAFRDFKDGAPLSMNLVVAEWKETAGQVCFKVISGTKPESVTASAANQQIFAAAAGTESDASGKPLNAVKAVVPARGSVVLEPADPKKRIKGHALVSADRYFPMIVPSVPGVLTDPDFECVIQGMLLAKDGKSIFSRPIGGNGAYTVIGLNQEKQLLILLVVDGYHPEKSPGCSLSDIPEIMFALGAKDVLCINAGPSGVLAVADENNSLSVISHPSDGGVFDHNGARPATNRIVLGAFNKVESTAKQPAKK